MLVPPLESDVGLGTAFVSGGVGTKGLLQFDGGAMSSALQFVASAGPFRFKPPNLMFTPAQSVSSWASSRTEVPGIWRIGLSIALRKPCIQASEAVTFSVTWNDTPRVSVFWMIPAPGR